MNRRSVLRSGTATVALPLLESLRLGSSALAAPALTAAATAAPKRMIWLGMGFGVTKQTWFPDTTVTGRDYKLPEGLAGLERHKADLTIIQGLRNKFSNEAHWGSTFWLTGANRYAKAGQSFYNSVSADQVAAEHLGQDTRFASLQLGAKKADGHGPGLSMAWNRQGKPIAGDNDPVIAYHRLFSEENISLEERQVALRQKRSVLDTVLEDARGVGRRVNQKDRDKLDEYFQSIREIEGRLAKTEEWLEVPKEKPADLREPTEGMAGVEEVKMMYNLMLAAMRVDATRVFTYRMPTDSFIASMGATITAHNMSHYDQGARMAVSQDRDAKHTELLAGFIDRLKATPESDGSTLYDNVALTFGSNISTVHNLTNCPTVLTGGAAGVEHGRHLVMKNDRTPLCNLWLTLLQGTGIEIEAHGDSNGTIEGLLG